MIKRLWRVFIEAVGTLWAQKCFAAGGIIPIGVVLLICSLIVVMVISVERVVEHQSEVVYTTIFIDQLAEKRAVNELIATLGSWPEVRTVKFVSSEEALRDVAWLLDGGELASQVPASDMLPPTLEVYLHVDNLIFHRYKHQAHLMRLSGDPIILDVISRKEDPQSFYAAFVQWEWVGIGVSIMLLLVNMFLVALLFMGKLEKTGREFELLLALGADTLELRGPHYLQGTLMGVCAGVLSTLATWGILFFLSNGQDQVRIFGWVGFDFLMSGLLPVAMLSGGLVGFLGAAVAVRFFQRMR